jgi:hypothetical protein
VKIVCHVLAYINSAANPIVYGFMSENFRQSFKSAFACQRLRQSKVKVAKENGRDKGQVCLRTPSSPPVLDTYRRWVKVKVVLKVNATVIKDKVKIK